MLRDAAYDQVELTDSPFCKQRQETIETYLAVPSVEDIIHTTRLKAGLSSSARGMTGWGPSIGQYLGAYAKLFRATGDERLREKGAALFEAWRVCADTNADVLKMGTYPYEKMLGGLLDMDEYMGVHAVEPYVRKLTLTAMEEYDPDIPRDGFQTDAMKGQIEWYTLPENLFRAYQMYGNEMYREYAQKWLYPYLWDKLAEKRTDVGPRHAYSHVNSLSSAARAYMVSKDKHFLDVITGGYEAITAGHLYATGGYGPAETLFGENPGYLGDALLSTWDNTFRNGKGIVYTNFAGGRVARSDAWGSCEVSCCSWAVFKLCNYLLKLTGEAKYGEWAEKLLINGTLGQIPVTRKGQILYYASYFSDGAIKSYDDRRLQHLGQNFVWQCCTGTFPQDVAEYSNMVAYFDDRTVYISQMIPAKIHAGQAVIESISEYPLDHRVCFKIHSPAPFMLDLAIRIPAWAERVEILRNGKKLEVRSQPSAWMRLEGPWKDGDEVSMSMPYSLHFEPVDAQHPNLVALCYGPMVLACDEMTVLVGDVQRPEEWIVPVDGEKCIFETKPGHAGIYPFVTRIFRPYWQIPAMTWYYMYNRIYPDLETLDREHQGF